MWLLVVLLPVAAFLVGYGNIQLYEARVACERTQSQNLVLLNSNLCADPWKRMMAGPKQDQVCVAAEEENQISVRSCAWKTVWEQGFVNQLWQRVTHSYWLLFGILAPTSCALVLGCFWSCGQRAARKQTAQMQRELLSTLKLLAPPLSEQPAKMKKPKKHYYETLPPPPMAMPTYYPDPRWTQFLVMPQPVAQPPPKQQVELFNG